MAFEMILMMHSCNIGIEMHRKRHREILTAVNLVNEEDREDVSPSQVSIRAGEPLPKAGCGSKKERKMKRKSAANSVRIPMVEIFTEADYVLVSEALYGKTTWGKSGGLKDENTTGQDFAETQAKSESTPEIKRKAARGENFKKRLQKAAGKLPSSPSAPKSDPLLGVDPKIFERLGVKLAGSNKWSKIRKENLKKLANIIAQDLEITEREGQEAEMREAGFWRFVTKKTAINLAELHEQFNWSTGELKKEPKPEAL
jgi:hypothetical protein